MYSHVTIGAADALRAKAFYDSVLATLGHVVTYDFAARGWYGYTAPGQFSPIFFIATPIDGNPASVGNGATVAFAAPDRTSVDSFHAAAVAAGGIDEGAPGLRAHYHPHYYGCYVRDPDGNKICCVCHLPAA